MKISAAHKVVQIFAVQSCVYRYLHKEIVHIISLQIVCHCNEKNVHMSAVNKNVHMSAVNKNVHISAVNTNVHISAVNEKCICLQ